MLRQSVQLHFTHDDISQNLVETMGVGGIFSRADQKWLNLVFTPRNWKNNLFLRVISKSTGGPPPSDAHGWDEFKSVTMKGRNEVSWPPGQKASLEPVCSNLRSFGTKCTVLKKVVGILIIPTWACAEQNRKWTFMRVWTSKCVWKALKWC